MAREEICALMQNAALGPRRGVKKSMLLAALVLGLILASCSERDDERHTPPPATTIAEVAASAPSTATALPETLGSQPDVAQATARPESPPPVAVSTAEKEFLPPDLGFLKEALDARLASFDGLASYYVHDLKGGQFATRHGDVAISGMSMVKVPILVETFRALDEAPTAIQTKLITETATLSGNYTANLLLELIAGRADPFAGAQEVTTALRQLGLYNTFIAVPYDLEPDARYLPTYATPANQNPQFDTAPDSSMQTTVNDMGRLLSALFACSSGQGSLFDVYGPRLTEEECREIVAVMERNDIDAFIEAGVPEGVAVAHKHGWVGDTHGDAAIVARIEHPYVLVITLHRPGWLEWADSTEIIADVSRLTYAHFTDPQAYTQDDLRADPPLLPTVAPTPDLPAAVIAGTGGAGLVMREAPGGSEIMVLPEGSLVFLADGAVVQEGGRAWRRVRLLGEASGWVVAEYLEMR